MILNLIFDLNLLMATKAPSARGLPRGLGGGDADFAVVRIGLAEGGGAQGAQRLLMNLHGAAENLVVAPGAAADAAAEALAERSMECPRAASAFW